jgi:hypothetical protein
MFRPDYPNSHNTRIRVQHPGWPTCSSLLKCHIRPHSRRGILPFDGGEYGASEKERQPPIETGAVGVGSGQIDECGIAARVAASLLSGHLGHFDAFGQCPVGQLL